MVMRPSPLGASATSVAHNTFLPPGSRAAFSPACCRWFIPPFFPSGPKVPLLSANAFCAQPAEIILRSCRFTRYSGISQIEGTMGNYYAHTAATAEGKALYIQTNRPPPGISTPETLAVDSFMLTSPLRLTQTRNFGEPAPGTL